MKCPLLCIRPISDVDMRSKAVAFLIGNFAEQVEIFLKNYFVFYGKDRIFADTFVKIPFDGVTERWVSG